MELPTLKNAPSTCSENWKEELDDHLIRLKVSELSAQEVAGSYRALCGQLLAQTLVALKKKQITKKEDVFDRKRARQWMDTMNVGVVTFTEVCETLDIDPRKTRRAVYQYAENPEASPISKTVIGALSHAD
jgi:hypothetical protein